MVTPMKIFSTFCFVVFLIAYVYSADIHTYKLQNPPLRQGLAGNGITDIQQSENRLWFGTGKGLSRLLVADNVFETFTSEHGVGRGSISALWVSGDTIWVATAVDTFTETTSSYNNMGTGLSRSYDGGTSWQRFDQPGVTPIQNLTYDIVVFHDIIWIASFGGGIKKSTDQGVTWMDAPPDSFIFDPLGNLNHRGFSLAATDEAIWVGTAGGINKSLDDGETWTNFNHTNQQHPISGNFVVALANQKTTNKDIIWAATWKAEGEDEYYAVSKSEDKGLSWQTFLNGQKAHNFAFDDSVVYVATDSGLFKSIDYGENWYVFPSIHDQVSGERIYTNEVYSVSARDGVVWVGTADGLAKTKNNGYTWQVYRSFPQTGKAGTPRTYAYPNPFSSFRHNQFENEGHVRFQFNLLNGTTITVRVYDFAMDLVKTITEDEYYPQAGDYNVAWDGRNDYGDMVANGVYFYSVEIESDGTYWGKVMVIN
jgi:hypothetical protein